MTKLAQAIEIVISATKNGHDKKTMLTEIQNTLNVSKGNASVYLFKANLAIEADQVPAPVATVPKIVVKKIKEIEPTPEEEVEFQADMKVRESHGYETMSFTEWKTMSENLDSLSKQFA